MISSAGVYAIRHMASTRTYIGSSRDIEKRFNQHVDRLNEGQHSNHGLQADWLKDGPSAFEFTVLEPRDGADTDGLNDAERKWTDDLAAHGIPLYGELFISRADREIPATTLSRMRLRASVSQRELAAMSGVAASTIARIELGHEAHPRTVRRLAKALGREPHELLGLE